MKLNQEKFLNNINAVWKNKMCPICSNTHWGIEAGIVTPVNVDENKTINLGGKFAPLVTITCDKCGYTMFVNALKLGALDLEQQNNGDKNE